MELDHTPSGRHTVLKIFKNAGKSSTFWGENVKSRDSFIEHLSSNPEQVGRVLENIVFNVVTQFSSGPTTNLVLLLFLIPPEDIFPLTF